MNVDELRRSFLRFFEDRGHRLMPSAPLVPIGDPTLLFTTAGMVQFKPYFMGIAEPPTGRMTSVQKCFRTTDIDEVGDDNHLTFFEMLGNFSVGDYFKRDAIAYAWEYVTGVLGIGRERLWITVFTDDDEAAEHWRAVGVEESRILRYGEAEGNYWFSGEVGPCGPCSELHFDFGPTAGCGACGEGACHPAVECGRFVEFWNLVFMSFFRHEDGSTTPLPQKNIDTGAGLERIARILQGKRSVYETDVFTPILERAAALTGQRYGEDAETDRALRIVAEHGRAVTFLIGDGVLPGNEGRGYVLRRELRRAVYFAGTLGLDRPFLEEIAAAVVAQMGHAYPEIERQAEFIRRVIRLEEERFRETIDRGVELLDEVIAALSGDTIAGDDVFRLYDTYGLPMELTAEIAARRGLRIDEAGYDRAMEQQRERARQSARFRLSEAAGTAYGGLAVHEPRFVGYDRLATETTLVGMVRDANVTAVAEAGSQVELVLRETPFYAEGGGQVGDTGWIKGPEGLAEVTDTVNVGEGLIVHRAIVAKGKLTQGDPVAAEVDAVRRADVMRNHTATHLVHAALREVLGEHVRQAGSLVAPDRFRFDFSHLEAARPEELRDVQRMVNAKLRADLPVRTRETEYRRAIDEGVLAFFGDRYGDDVRVVEIPDDGTAARPFSAELCGGTHVHATGEVGYILLIGESSIGAGVRRVEALSGRGAEAYIEQRLTDVDALSRRLRVPPREIEGRVAALLDELEIDRRKLQELDRKSGLDAVETLAERVRQVDGVAVLATAVRAGSAAALREVGDALRARLDSAVVVLGAVVDEKPSFVAFVSSDLTARGLHAGNLIKEVAALTGGGGGGRPDMAQAGGKDAGRLEEALGRVEGLVRERLA